MSEALNKNKRDVRLKTLTSWLIVIALGSFTAVFLYGAVITMTGAQGEWLMQIAQKQFPATIGLPFAALAALSLVLILEFRAGKIEFEGFGFRFRGASGPIILWVISFLAITTAIKMLWNN
jgi:hypothetical protein